MDETIDAIVHLVRFESLAEVREAESLELSFKPQTTSLKTAKSMHRLVHIIHNLSCLPQNMMEWELEESGYEICMRCNVES